MRVAEGFRNLKELLGQINSDDTKDVIRGIKRFSLQVKGTAADDGDALLWQYLDSSPQVIELFTLLDSDEGQKYELGSSIMSLLGAILKTPTAARSRSSQLGYVSHRVVKAHLKTIYSLLGAGNEEIALSGLEVLSSIADLSLGSCRYLCQRLNFSNRSLAQLINRGKPDTIRAKFMELMVSILKHRDSELTKSVATAKGFLDGVVRNLSHSPSLEHTEKVLDSIASAILDGKNCSIVVATSFWSGHMIDSLLKVGELSPAASNICDKFLEKMIAFATQTVETAQFKRSRRISGRTASQSTLRSNRRSKTQAASGIDNSTAFHKSDDMNVRCANGLMLRLMSHLKPNYALKHMALIVRISQIFPRARDKYLNQLPFSFEPRLSLRWLANISLVCKLIRSKTFTSASALRTANAEEQLNRLRYSPPNILVGSLLPQGITRTMLSQGIQHSDCLVQYSTLRLIFEILLCFERMSEPVREMAQGRSQKGRSSLRKTQLKDSRGSLLPAMRQSLAGKLPSLEILFSLMSKVGVRKGKGKKSDNKSAKEPRSQSLHIAGKKNSRRALMSNVLYQIMRVYRRALPEHYKSTNIDCWKILRHAYTGFERSEESHACVSAPRMQVVAVTAAVTLLWEGNEIPLNSTFQVLKPKNVSVDKARSEGSRAPFSFGPASNFGILLQIILRSKRHESLTALASKAKRVATQTILNMALGQAKKTHISLAVETACSGRSGVQYFDHIFCTFSQQKYFYIELAGSLLEIARRFSSGTANNDRKYNKEVTLSSAMEITCPSTLGLVLCALDAASISPNSANDGEALLFELFKDKVGIFMTRLLYWSKQDLAISLGELITAIAVLGQSMESTMDDGNGVAGSAKSVQSPDTSRKDALIRRVSCLIASDMRFYFLFQLCSRFVSTHVSDDSPLSASRLDGLISKSDQTSPLCSTLYLFKKFDCGKDGEGWNLFCSAFRRSQAKLSRFQAIEGVKEGYDYEILLTTLALFPDFVPPFSGLALKMVSPKRKPQISADVWNATALVQLATGWLPLFLHYTRRTWSQSVQKPEESFINSYAVRNSAILATSIASITNKKLSTFLDFLSPAVAHLMLTVNDLFFAESRNDVDSHSWSLGENTMILSLGCAVEACINRFQRRNHPSKFSFVENLANRDVCNDAVHLEQLETVLPLLANFLRSLKNAPPRRSLTSSTSRVMVEALLVSAAHNSHKVVSVATENKSMKQKREEMRRNDVACHVDSLTRLILSNTVHLLKTGSMTYANRQVDTNSDWITWNALCSLRNLWHWLPGCRLERVFMLGRLRTQSALSNSQDGMSKEDVRDGKEASGNCFNIMDVLEFCELLKGKKRKRIGMNREAKSDMARLPSSSQTIQAEATTVLSNLSAHPSLVKQLFEFYLTSGGGELYRLPMLIGRILEQNLSLDGNSALRERTHIFNTLLRLLEDSSYGEAHSPQHRPVVRLLAANGIMTGKLLWDWMVSPRRSTKAEVCAKILRVLTLSTHLNPKIPRMIAEEFQTKDTVDAFQNRLSFVTTHPTWLNFLSELISSSFFREGVRSKREQTIPVAVVKDMLISGVSKMLDVITRKPERGSPSPILESIQKCIENGRHEGILSSGDVYNILSSCIKGWSNTHCAEEDNDDERPCNNLSRIVLGYTDTITSKSCEKGCDEKESRQIASPVMSDTHKSKLLVLWMIKLIKCVTRQSATLKALDRNPYICLLDASHRYFRRLKIKSLGKKQISRVNNQIENFMAKFQESMKSGDPLSPTAKLGDDGDMTSHNVSISVSLTLGMVYCQSLPQEESSYVKTDNITDVLYSTIPVNDFYNFFLTCKAQSLQILHSLVSHLLKLEADNNGNSGPKLAESTNDEQKSEAQSASNITSFLYRIYKVVLFSFSGFDSSGDIERLRILTLLENKRNALNSSSKQQLSVSITSESPPCRRWGKAALQAVKMGERKRLRDLDWVYRSLDLSILRRGPVRQKRSTKASLQMPGTGGQHEHVYNPEFMLLFLLRFVQSSQLDCRKFADSGALAYTILSTSLANRKLRATAFDILGHFFSFLEQTAAFHAVEKAPGNDPEPGKGVFTKKRFKALGYEFREHKQINTLMLCFKNSITEEAQQVPWLITRFTSRVIPLLLRPDQLMYKHANKFLLQRPFLDLEDVPMFYTTFFSGSGLNAGKERIWMLKYLLAACDTTEDMRILSRRHVVPILVTYHESMMAEKLTRSLIVQILLRLLSPAGDANHAKQSQFKDESQEESSSQSEDEQEFTNDVDGSEINHVDEDSIEIFLKQSGLLSWLHAIISDISKSPSELRPILNLLRLVFERVWNSVSRREALSFPKYLLRELQLILETLRKRATSLLTRARHRAERMSLQSQILAISAVAFKLSSCSSLVRFSDVSFLHELLIEIDPNTHDQRVLLDMITILSATTVESNNSVSSNALTRTMTWCFQALRIRSTPRKRGPPSEGDIFKATNSFFCWLRKMMEGRPGFTKAIAESTSFCFTNILYLTLQTRNRMNRSALFSKAEESFPLLLGKRYAECKTASEPQERKKSRRDTVDDYEMLGVKLLWADIHSKCESNRMSSPAFSETYNLIFKRSKKRQKN